MVVTKHFPSSCKAATLTAGGDLINKVDCGSTTCKDSASYVTPAEDQPKDPPPPQGQE